ncbi:MAG: D-glycero-beta-D-manno-heptose 1-phosphate adenylyltransferase [Bdellovibrionota bacterium]
MFSKTPSKIQSRYALKKTISQLRKKSGKKIRVVFTNGCFDLLHRGHVSYLEKARLLGDILVVALNTDISVKAIKGDGRPINTLKDRMVVMAALQAVDYVTWFNETTPLSLINFLKPDILVKGGDWKTRQIVGAKEVLSWGGRVRSLKYLTGFSTTNLLSGR